MGRTRRTDHIASVAHTTNLEEDEVGVRLRHGEEDQCEGCCDSAVHDGRTHLRKAGVRSLLAGACKGISNYAH